MEFNFEEKEQYTLEEMKELVKKFEGQAQEEIEAKYTTIQELNTKLEDVEELDKQNKELSQRNLALKNGIDEEVIEFVADDDLEKMQEKIDKFKEITKEKKIDSSFKPERKKKNEDGYEKAIKDNDIEGALKHKFSRFFK